MLGFDLEYGWAFSLGGVMVGRLWAGVGVLAGSTKYAHVDEPYNSEGHVREIRLMGGVDFLLGGVLAVGPWIGSAWGDTTATVYDSVAPGEGRPPGRISYTVFNVGGRVLLVF
jgi:hypothetical protein